MNTPNLTRRIIVIILSSAGILLAAAAAFYGIRKYRSQQAAEEQLKIMRLAALESQEEASAQSSSASGTEASEAEPDPPSTEPVPEASDIPLTDNPYQESFLANEDMAGWLQVPGTNIDYPIMWTPRDENYYLKRGFDGKSNSNGCLILDTDSCVDPLTTNLIIHGHNMRSGAMFGYLTKYEDPDYCREHSLITLYTEEVQRNYEVLAVFRSQVFLKTDQVFKFYQFFQAGTEEEFQNFYQNIKELSLYDTGVTAEFGDRFITLSTCSYHVEQGRFVVVAKEIESGDHYLPFREENSAATEASVE